MDGGLAVVVLATALQFTYPSMDGFPCDSLAYTVTDDSGAVVIQKVAVPLSGLTGLRLWGNRRFTLRDTLLAEQAIPAGSAGQPGSVSFEDQGAEWTVWVTTLDGFGNESCPSNLVAVNGGVVGTPAWVIPEKRELFDLAGRRVAGAVRSGIYFERVTNARGVTTKRVVVLR